jgi:hypothetical protein
MEPFMIFAGVVGAVVVLVLVSSTGLRTQGYRGNPRQSPGNQGGVPGQFGGVGDRGGGPPGQFGSAGNMGGRPPGQSGGAGTRGGSGGGLLQLFAIVGVLVLLGACGLMIVALTGVQ